MAVRTRRVGHCVNSSGGNEPCWCPLASVMCARQSHNRDSFFAAIRQGRNDVVTFLMSKANCEQERITDLREWLHARDLAGRSCVQAAVKYKKERVLDTLLDIIKEQLDFALLVDLKDHQGFTPMLEASRLGHVRMVKKLRTLGAVWTNVNNEHQNARDLALVGGHEEIVDYFDQGQDMPEDVVVPQAVDAEDEENDDNADHSGEDDVAGEAVGHASLVVVGAPAGPQSAEAPEEEVSDVDAQELQDRCDILAMHGVLAALDLDAIQAVAAQCVLRKYMRNDVILSSHAEKDARACLFFVLSGEVRVQKVANDRHDVLLEEGDTYGEKALLLGKNKPAQLPPCFRGE